VWAFNRLSCVFINPRIIWQLLMTGIPYGALIRFKSSSILLTMTSIWDWQRQVRLNGFSNANPPGSRINEIRYINGDDQALLLTGSSDGVIKIYRNYEVPRKIEVVTAFRALTDLIPNNKNAGLVLDRQQGAGRALVGGDVKVIRVWNAATEICTTGCLSFPSSQPVPPSSF
jgi:WD40 repeat protein